MAQGTSIYQWPSLARASPSWPGSIGIWAKVARLLRDEGSVRLSGIAVLAARKAVAALGPGGTRKMPPQQTQLLPRSYERERMAMIEIAVTAQHTIR